MMDEGDEKKTDECIISVNLKNSGQCRICFEEDDIINMITPCLCSGSVKYVHLDCLNEWREITRNIEAKKNCLVCKFDYVFESMPTLYFHKILSFFEYNLIIFSSLHYCLFLPLFIFDNEQYFYVSNMCWYICNCMYLLYIRKRYLTKTINCVKIILSFLYVSIMTGIVLLILYLGLAIFAKNINNIFVFIIPFILIFYFMDYYVLLKIQKYHLKIFKKNPRIISIN